MSAQLKLFTSLAQRVNYILPLRSGQVLNNILYQSSTDSGTGHYSVFEVKAGNKAMLTVCM
ncbi:hypothetical protein [Salmonella enterica]|uniref:hypothetical protein n=1 Tax=Salmonella enterica TaxID=28901 RepID=UPI0034507993